MEPVARHGGDILTCMIIMSRPRLEQMDGDKLKNPKSYWQQSMHVYAGIEGDKRIENTLTYSSYILYV
jgi:hypothetical protein